MRRDVLVVDDNERIVEVLRAYLEREGFTVRSAADGPGAPGLPRLVWFLVPRRRPMDNVQVGWQAPQEDEFALCSLGVPSPYLRIAFPNDADDYLRYLDLQDVDAATLAAWQAARAGAQRVAE